MVFFSFDDASLRLCLCYAFAVIKLLLIRTFAWSKREKNPHNYNNSISVFSIRSWPSWPITKARNWGKKKVCIVYSLKTWLEMTFYCLIFFSMPNLATGDKLIAKFLQRVIFLCMMCSKTLSKAYLHASYKGFAWMRTEVLVMWTLVFQS